MRQIRFEARIQPAWKVRTLSEARVAQSFYQTYLDSPSPKHVPSYEEADYEVGTPHDVAPLSSGERRRGTSVRWLGGVKL